MSNLNFIFKNNKTDKEKKVMIENMYYNLIQNIGSFIENQNITKNRLLQKVTFVNENIMINALESNRPIIFITAHLSNWEILPLAIASKYTPLVGVGRPLKQPTLDKILKRNREKFGIKMIPKSGAMRGLAKSMKEKKVVGLLIDQNIEGIDVDFFDKKVMHTTSAALLSYKYDAIVIPCFIKRVDTEKYIATFYKPIDVPKNLQLDKYILLHTQKQAKITEEIIKESPEEWLWIHRRWKANYPEIYS